MPDIVHELPIAAGPARVYSAVSTPDGLDAWWTERSEGSAEEGSAWRLGFGPGYDWRAVVVRAVPNALIEWELTRADRDWTGTRVGLALDQTDDGGTRLRFHHTGWPEANDHYRISCTCWAFYLRLLKRYVERSEVVPYPDRLEA